MPDWRIFVALLFLLSPATAQPGSGGDAFALDARILASSVLNISGLNVDYPDSSVNVEGCNAQGAVRIFEGQNAFIFTEQGDEAACALTWLDVFLPPGAQSMEVSFQADRVKIPTLEQPVFQQRFIQQLQVLDGDVLVDYVDYYDAAGEEQSEAKEFTFVMRLPEGRTQVRLAWYFEDAQPSANTDDTPPVTPSWRSTVRNPFVQYEPYAVPFTTEHHPEVVDEINETVTNSFTATATLDDRELNADSNSLELDVVASHQLVHVHLPGGTMALPKDLLQSALGGVTTVALPPSLVDATGAYEFHFESVSPLVLVEAKAVTLFPLAWVGIVIPVLLGVLASGHHEWFRRNRAESQNFVWGRMLTTLVALWVGYILFLAAWLARSGWRHMGTLPVDAEGTLYWALVAMATILWLVHVGIGSMRRNQAKRLVHEAELAQRNTLLEQSNLELEQFAFMAAHDLQEPLRKVIGYTTLLQHRYQGKLDAKADGYINEASHQADRMRRLIGDVLSFSRMGKEAEMVDVDLDAVYSDIKQDIPEELAKTGVKLTGSNLGNVHGNPSMIRQLLENLVGNGIKYSKPNTVPRIRITTEQLPNGVKVSVTDNGIGIEPEFQERVFGVFERLHGASSAYQGTGIGLAICKKVVEAHGGTIGLESTPGKGSTFFFTLPHGGDQ